MTRERRFLAALAAATIFLRLALLAGVLATNPGRTASADTPGYVQPALALARTGSFTSAPDTPGTWETIRTPGYPAFLAAVFLLFGERLGPALAVQAAASALTLLLVFGIARHLWGEREGAAAALVLALDPLSLLASQMALTDALYCLLLTAALLAGARLLGRDAPRPREALLFGALLAAATLVRPVSYYLIWPLALVVVLAAGRAGGGWRTRAALLGMLLLPWVLLVGGWQARNLVRTGSATFSHITGTQLYLYRGAAILAAIEGVPEALVRERLQEKAARRGEPVAVRQDRFAREGAAIMRDHPLLTLAGQARGTAQMLLLPGESDLAAYLGADVPPTGVAGDLLRLAPRDFAARWLSGAPALLAGFLVALLYLGLVYAGAARAGWEALRSGWGPRAGMHLLLAATLAYLVVVTAGPEAYPRYRLPLMPLLAVYAGRGLPLLLASARRRLGPASSPA